MIGATLGFNTDHFIYSYDRPNSGRWGACSLCGDRFVKGDHVRIAGALDDDGYWHETCTPPKEES